MLFVIIDDLQSPTDLWPKNTIMSPNVQNLRGYISLCPILYKTKSPNLFQGRGYKEGTARGYDQQRVWGCFAVFFGWGGQEVVVSKVDMVPAYGKKIALFVSYINLTFLNCPLHCIFIQEKITNERMNHVYQFLHVCSHLEGNSGISSGNFQLCFHDVVKLTNSCFLASLKCSKIQNNQLITCLYFNCIILVIFWISWYNSMNLGTPLAFSRMTLGDPCK